MRLLAVCLAALTLAAGIAARSDTLPPPWAKYVGVALWCTLVYWLILFARPRIAVWSACLVAVAIGWAVEFLQFTPLPARLAAAAPLSRWVLGTTFSAADLPAYLGGACLAAAMHLLLRRCTARLDRSGRVPT